MHTRNCFFPPNLGRLVPLRSSVKQLWEQHSFQLGLNWMLNQHVFYPLLWCMSVGHIAFILILGPDQVCLVFFGKPTLEMVQLKRSTQRFTFSASLRLYCRPADAVQNFKPKMIPTHPYMSLLWDTLIAHWLLFSSLHTSHFNSNITTTDSLCYQHERVIPDIRL